MAGMLYEGNVLIRFMLFNQMRPTIPNALCVGRRSSRQPVSDVRLLAMPDKKKRTHCLRDPTNRTCSASGHRRPGWRPVSTCCTCKLEFRLPCTSKKCSNRYLPWIVAFQRSAPEKLVTLPVSVVSTEDFQSKKTFWIEYRIGQVCGRVRAKV